MQTPSKWIILLLMLCAPVCTFAAYDPNHFDPDNAAHWYGWANVKAGEGDLGA